MSEFVDYYATLQVHPDADPEVIEKAYKALIFKHHPDKGGDTEKAKDIVGAYYVLSDVVRRRQYDVKYKAQASAASSPKAPDPVVIDDIPPEVIDYLLARTFVEGAAATARTAARVVGAAAVVGAVSVAGAASAGVRAIQEERQQVKDTKAKRLEAEHRAAVAEAKRVRTATDRAATVELAAEVWRPRPSKAAVELFKDCQRGATSFPRGELTDNDLLWLAVRHTNPLVRRRAFSFVWDGDTDRKLVTQRDAFADPVVIFDGSDGITGELSEGPWKEATRASLVRTDGVARIQGSARRARSFRSAALVLVLLGILAVAVTQTNWSNVSARVQGWSVEDALSSMRRSESLTAEQYTVAVKGLAADIDPSFEELERGLQVGDLNRATEAVEALSEIRDRAASLVPPFKFTGTHGRLMNGLNGYCEYAQTVTRPRPDVTSSYLDQEMRNDDFMLLLRATGQFGSALEDLGL